MFIGSVTNVEQSAAPRADEVTVMLVACGRGQARAFESLYDMTRARLFGLAVRMLKREDLAEEVLQDAFVAIWNSANRFDPQQSAAMTWMSRIVRNRCLDQLRRPMADDQELDEAILDTLADENPGPLALLAQSKDAARLARCMERLDSASRRSILMAFFEDLSHSELAKALAQPLGTVKARIRRGLMNLKSCLES